MAEVHYLGEIASGTNFPENRLCVRFKVKSGSGWKLISGLVYYYLFLKIFFKSKTDLITLN